jgi:serine/threonine-protein kinase
VDQRSGRPVAIRFFDQDVLQDEHALNRLRQQTKAATALTHKNIQRTYGLGRHEAGRYVASEYIDGQSLRQLLSDKREQRKNFSLKGTYNIAAHVCNALAAAHQAGLAHGLLGPGSILVNSSGRVKLVDFGIYPALSPMAGPLLGIADRYCLAPELGRDLALATPASDLYSLGALLYELLSGHPPGTQRQLLRSLASHANDEVSALVERYLAEDPRGRGSSATEVKSALYHALHGAESAMGDELGAPLAPSDSVGGAHQHSPPGPTSTPGASLETSPARSREVSIDFLLSRVDDQSAQKWLIQKNRMDFGPFALDKVKEQIKAGEIGGNDTIIDYESHDRCLIKQHPLLKEFTLQVEREHALHEAQRAQVDLKQKQRKRKIILATSAIALGLGAAASVVLVYLLQREPEVQIKPIYRDRPQEDLSGLIKSIEIRWTTPEQKPKLANKNRRKSSRGTGGPAGGSDVTDLGDASRAGGDEQLSQATIQKTMASKENMRRLTPCLIRALKDDRSLARVAIDFSIKGSGQVGFVRVNQSTSGPLHACVSKRMRPIKFPSFDGSRTQASFEITVR